MTDRDSDTIVLTYKCRLQPTKAQRRALECVLDQQRQLYNAALAERIDAYRKTGSTISVGDQKKSLTLIRADDPAFAAVQRRIQAGTLDKLDRAYKAFFRRAKQGAGASAGFPRFKGRDFFDGFHFDAPLQIKWDGKRLRFSGMAGGLRVSKADRSRLPAPLFADPKGKGNWKGIWFKREGQRWSCGFQVELPIKPRARPCGSGAIGIDWGTSMLAALSSGEIVPNIGATPDDGTGAPYSVRIGLVVASTCMRGTGVLIAPGRQQERRTRRHAGEPGYSGLISKKNPLSHPRARGGGGTAAYSRRRNCARVASTIMLGTGIPWRHPDRASASNHHIAQTARRW